MNTPARSLSIQHHAAQPAGWHELWLKEDWWAVWLGLSIVLVALGLWLGLVISNVIGLPAWLDAGFRVEFYVKTGIVAGVLVNVILGFALCARVFAPHWQHLH
jgi:hypothetical protein